MRLRRAKAEPAAWLEAAAKAKEVAAELGEVETVVVQTVAADRV